MPLQLPPGTQLSLLAPRIELDSSISSLAGTLLVESGLTSDYSGPAGGSLRPGIIIGDGVTLDVSGQWTNDAMLSTGVGMAPTYLSGGKVALQLTAPGSELVIGDDVSLKANGGAWLESGGTISYGSGGAITLDASPSQSAIQFGQGTLVEAFGTGTALGGTFTLYATRLNISEGIGTAWTEPQIVDDLNNPAGPVLNVFAPLFTNYGFSSVNLTATGAAAGSVTSDVLTVASGTMIDAQTSTLQLESNYLSSVTGGTVSALATPTLLPLYERPVANVSLNVIRETDDVLLGNTNYGVLDIQAGASILTDPGATIALSGEGGVSVAGTLRAPAGKVSVFIPSPEDISSNNAAATDPGYLPTLGIDVASSAVLDVSGSTV